MKIVVTWVFIFLVGIFSCSKENRGDTENRSPERQIENILNMPAVVLSEPENTLNGTWTAKQLGVVLTGAGYNLPSKIVFRDNGSYEYNVKFGNVLFEGNGVFRLDSTQVPYRIELKQTYPRSAVYFGVLNFATKNIMRIIFYRSDFLPAPIKFEAESTQIFERTN